MGLLKAMLDAIVGSDNQIAGQAFTRLTAPLAVGETALIEVESTIGFGENTDATGDSKLLIGKEIITATGRSTVDFTTLSRGAQSSIVKLHPTGTLVMDFASNSSALDHIYRGLLVNYAIGEDLNVIGRNLGLIKCPGLDDDTWREVIKAVAYLPKQTTDAFREALTALYGAGNFEVADDFVNPYRVKVYLPLVLASGLTGRFYMNGGETQLTTGALTVDTDEPINQVLGVYLDTPAARTGLRSGTNYFTSGSFLGNTITLGSSPGALGTAVIVDYGAFAAHYMTGGPVSAVPPVSTLDNVIDPENFRPFLGDAGATAACLLNQVRAAGVGVDIYFT